MALVERGGNNPLVAGLAGWLGGHLTRATVEQINQLAEDIANDIVMGGAEALGGIRGTITEFARNSGMTIRGGLNDWVERTSQALEQVGHRLIPPGEGMVWNAERGEWVQGQELEIPDRADDGVIDEFDDLDAGDDTTLDDMETIEEVQQAARSGATVSSGGGSSGGPVSKETPVSPGEPSYGLQETHTTLCNFDGWFSVTTPDFATPIVTEFRLTQPHDMLATTLDTVAQAGAWTKGAHNVPFDNAVSRVSSATVFPQTTPAVASVTDRASWFTYWARIYEYYTVTKCDYEIKIHNPSSTNTNAMLLGMDFNTHTDVAGASGNKTPQNAALIDMMAFKGIKWMNLTESNAISPNGSLTIIKGSYRPGQARRNIVNDGDVKTWNLINDPATPSSPTLKELLTLYFYRAPMNYVLGTTIAGVNVQYTLKYTVQFKDLRAQARYPCVAGTDIVQTIDTDTVQVL